VTAGCIDTDLPAGRRNTSLSDKPLIETTHVHHAMWVMSIETCCEYPDGARTVVATRLELREGEISRQVDVVVGQDGRSNARGMREEQRSRHGA
jgi:hypothetical protein